MRTLVTFGLGALAMYLLDPEQGRRRRALLRDQITHARRLMGERTGAAMRDVSNRAYGVAKEAQRAVTSDLEQQKPAESPQGAQHLGR
jgi:hypothetical protein